MRSSTVPFSLREQAATCSTPDFNHLARIYRWMEWLTFGPFLQCCRCAYLPSLGPRRQALILGDGDGRFTARLLQSNCAIEVDAVDASETMLRQLASRTPTSRIRTHLADARNYTPIRRDYDLIATHFFLDCLDSREVRDLAGILRNHANPRAIWVISEFAIPSNLYGRTVAGALISALYFAFGLLTRLQIRKLPDHHAALAQSGWSLMQQTKRLGGLLISELWQLNP